MSTATTEAPAIEVGEAVVQWPYRMSYEAYMRIATLGLIRPEEHVTLLDGILVQAMTKGPDLGLAMLGGHDVLRASCPPGWHVRPEQPIALPDGRGGDSAPEPDLSVAPGTMDRYPSRHPGVGQVGLVVEVATTAAMYAGDRAGLRRYAHAGIPTAWIVTPHDRKLHVHSEPSGPSAVPGYARVEVKQAGELIEASLPPLAPGEPPAVLGPIAVASFFPPAG